jgi:hypothetical protein
MLDKWSIISTFPSSFLCLTSSKSSVDGHLAEDCHNYVEQMIETPRCGDIDSTGMFPSYKHFSTVTFHIFYSLDHVAVGTVYGIILLPGMTRRFSPHIPLRPSGKQRCQRSDNPILRVYWDRLIIIVFEYSNTGSRYSLMLACH